MKCDASLSAAGEGQKRDVERPCRLCQPRRLNCSRKARHGVQKLARAVFANLEQHERRRLGQRRHADKARPGLPAVSKPKRAGRAEAYMLKGQSRFAQPARN